MSSFLKMQCKITQCKSSSVIEMKNPECKRPAIETYLVEMIRPEFVLQLFVVHAITLVLHLTGLKCEKILASAPNLHVQLNDVLFMEVVRPSSISYTYKIRPAKNFGTEFSKKYNNIELVMADPFHGCSRILNSDFIINKIAFVQRGECSFVTKALQAEEAGAIAVVISDNDINNAQNFVDMIDDSTERSVNIPAVFLLGKDGYMIRNEVQRYGLQNALVNIPINVTGASIYQITQPPWTLW